jgi:hypothetical protein
VYVVEVTKIITATDPVADKSRNDGRMLMDVIFEVDCLVFICGEIIADVIITKLPTVTDKSLSGYIGNKDNPIAHVFVNDAENQTYKLNSKGPVIVHSVEYTIGQSATIKAITFKPMHRKVNLYHCVGSLSDSDHELIDTRIAYIRQQQTSVEKFAKKHVEFFRKVLHVHVGERKMDNTVDILEPQILEGKYVAKPTEHVYASTLFSLSSDSQDLKHYTTSTEPIRESSSAVYNHLLDIIETELNSLLSMLNAYPLAELPTHQHFFSNFQRMKTPSKKVNAEK